MDTCGITTFEYLHVTLRGSEVGWQLGIRALRKHVWSGFCAPVLGVSRFRAQKTNAKLEKG